MQKNGLQILLSPKTEDFVPLLRVSKSVEVCKLDYEHSIMIMEKIFGCPHTLVQVLQNVKRCFCEGQLIKCTVLGPKKDTKKKGVYDLSMIGKAKNII